MSQVLSVLDALMKWLIGGTVGSGENAVTSTGAINQWLATIMDQPVLLLYFVLPIIGLGIGIISRLTKANR